MPEPLQVNDRSGLEPSSYGRGWDRERLKSSPFRPVTGYAVVPDAEGVGSSTNVNEPLSAALYAEEEGIVSGRGVMSREEKAALIPTWAAIVFAAGFILALAGFIAAWFLSNGVPLLIMTAGLACSAAGMQEAERSIETARTPPLS